MRPKKPLSIRVQHTALSSTPLTCVVARHLSEVILPSPLIQYVVREFVRLKLDLIFCAELKHSDYFIVIIFVRPWYREVLKALLGNLTLLNSLELLLKLVF